MDEPSTIEVYNHTTEKATANMNKDPDNGERDIAIVSYSMFKNDLISSNTVNEIRIWDLTSWRCKRVIYSFVSNPTLIAFDDFFATVNIGRGKSYLQTWKFNELQLYPTIKAKYFVRDIFILSKYVIAILTEEGIEVWNIGTMRLISSYCFKLRSMNKLDFINSFLIASSDFHEGDGQMLYIYDYRRFSPICEIDKGYDSSLFLNLNGRNIAYILSGLMICIFDTQTQSDDKNIPLPVQIPAILIL
jgi:hypothetical protein